jgi:hypothetical protein
MDCNVLFFFSKYELDSLNIFNIVLQNALLSFDICMLV